MTRPREWCEALSSISRIRRALRANLKVSTFHMTLTMFFGLRFTIWLHTGESARQWFRLIFELWILRVWAEMIDKMSCANWFDLSQSGPWKSHFHGPSGCRKVEMQCRGRFSSQPRKIQWREALSSISRIRRAYGQLWRFQHFTWHWLCFLA